MSEKKLSVYRTIDDVNENQWNNVVEHSGRGSVFHRTGWLKAVEDGLDRTARHLVVEKGENPVGLIPNFVVDIDVPVSTPDFLDGFRAKRMASSKPGFGGPLFVGSEQSNFELMFEHVDPLLSDQSVIQHHIRTVDDGSVRYARPFTKFGYDLTVHSCRFTIDLTQGWDPIEENMENSKRSNVVAARENEATVEEWQPQGADLEEFYATYADAMDRVDGAVHPFAFFECLGEELADRVKLFTVDVDGELAGGQLYLLDDERSTVHVFVCGIDEEFFEYNPTELLDAYGMQWGIEHGYDTYDLGSTRPDFTYGPFKYKKELGGCPRPILSWERGCSTLGWPAYRFGKWMYRNRLS